MTQKTSNTFSTSTHWGNYKIEVKDDQIAGVRAYDSDQDPSPISQSLLDVTDARVRVSQPMVREGFLKNGSHSDRTQRGRDPFIPVSWEKAYKLVASELNRVRSEHGSQSIYAGSYGWSSPGTLHIARWNMHRLLNLTGGFTDSVQSYSLAACEAIMPYVLDTSDNLMFDAPSWLDIAENAEFVVMFGGTALKNSQVSFGGLGAHTAKADMETAVNNGVQFVNISPIRDDVAHQFETEWFAPRPNTDTAIMLGMAYTLVTEDLHDKHFLDTYTVGFEQFLPYLMGERDGQPKTPEWAESISEMSANSIRSLARQMADKKTMIAVNWAIQRAQHGEQPFWMATVLASLLGEVGLPGRGLVFGLNAMHAVGSSKRPFVHWPSRTRGSNPLQHPRIPVARIADMLLNPGQPFQFDGKDLTYPDIRLIYWVGGNPFHHHQDINRLIKAWQQPETIIINDPFWTPTARYSDIVLPATTVLERNDLNFTNLDATITPMRQAIRPFAQAQSDYDIFHGIAQQMDVGEVFSEGRTEMEWIRHFYEEAKSRVKEAGQELPDFETFWLGEQLVVESGERRETAVEKFRSNPNGAPLPTPSGKIEIFSETIDGFGYDDCLGHPAWLPPLEWLGADISSKYPLHLLSNQPKTRLHSQLDFARTSKNAKKKEREPARMNPQDAADRGVQENDFIRIYNDRGACLSVVQLSETLRRGVIELPTGAWFNPANPNEQNSLEIHGNPNILTRDVGTSKLGQGPSPNSTLVEVEKYEGPIPEITVFDLPSISDGD